jgi:hypothetical protein
MLKGAQPKLTDPAMFGSSGSTRCSDDAGENELYVGKYLLLLFKSKVDRKSF